MFGVPGLDAGMRVVPDDPRASDPEVNLCDGARTGKHADHGCWRCCERCNTDDHRCPGCGVATTHAVGVCLRCRREC